MNANHNDKTEKQMLYIMNAFLLLVHTGLLILFTVLHVTLMSRVNIISVLCYLVSFLLIKKEKMTEYIVLTFIEIAVHSFLAVISTGWGIGFQLYFIGCVAVIFFADYFSVHTGRRRVKGFGLSLLSILLYIISFLILRFYGSIYQLDERIASVDTIFNSLVALGFVTLIFSLLTNAATFYEAELEKQANHDKLTGMKNRHYLVDHLGTIYTSRNVESHWLAILDIDNFKKINDKYGHLCGNFVLRTVAEIITNSCSDQIACRWGGEEFLIVGADSGRDTENRNSVPALLEDIRRSIAVKDFVYNDNTVINLTVTIGVARYQNGQTVDEWINVADGRLYNGKQTGKNKIVGTD